MYRVLQERNTWFCLLQAVERDEIIRCLTEPDTTVVQAAAKLGLSRATIYRKMAQYGITIPHRNQPW